MAGSAWLLLLAGPGKPSKKNVLPHCSMHLLTESRKAGHWQAQEEKQVENCQEKRPGPSVCGRAAAKQTLLLLPTPGEDIKPQPWQGQHSGHSSPRLLGCFWCPSGFPAPAQAGTATGFGKAKRKAPAASEETRQRGASPAHRRDTGTAGQPLRAPRLRPATSAADCRLQAFGDWGNTPAPLAASCNATGSWRPGHR